MNPGLLQALMNPTWGDQVSTLGNSLGQQLAGVPRKRAEALKAQKMKEEEERIQKQKALSSLFQIGATSDLTDPQVQEALTGVANSFGIDYETALKIAQNGEKATKARMAEAAKESDAAKKRARVENSALWFESNGDKSFGQAIRMGIVTPEFAQKYVRSEKDPERKNKIPPELKNQLAALAQGGDEYALTLMQGLAETDSSTYVTRALDYVKERKREADNTAQGEEPKGMSDSSVTKMELQTYADIANASPYLLRAIGETDKLIGKDTVREEKLRPVAARAEQLRENDPRMTQEDAILEATGVAPEWYIDTKKKLDPDIIKKITALRKVGTPWSIIYSAREIQEAVGGK